MIGLAPQWQNKMLFTVQLHAQKTTLPPLNCTRKGVDFRVTLSKQHVVFCAVSQAFMAEDKCF